MFATTATANMFFNFVSYCIMHTGVHKVDTWLSGSKWHWTTSLSEVNDMQLCSYNHQEYESISSLSAPLVHFLAYLPSAVHGKASSLANHEEVFHAGSQHITSLNS